MSEHIVRATLDAGTEPSPSWEIVCPDGCDCEIGAWVDAEGGWPMFDLHQSVELVMKARVWWDDCVQVDPLPGSLTLYLTTPEQPLSTPEEA